MKENTPEKREICQENEIVPTKKTKSEDKQKNIPMFNNISYKEEAVQLNFVFEGTYFIYNGNEENRYVILVVPKNNRKVQLSFTPDKITIIWFVHLNMIKFPDFRQVIPEDIKNSMITYFTSGETKTIKKDIHLHNKISTSKVCREENDQWIFLVLGFEKLQDEVSILFK